ELLDTRFRRQFYLEQARSFVWGLQPTIANFRASQLADRPEETDYMMRLARIRARALDYLLYGEFLRPPELSVPWVDVDLSRVSIYAARRGGPTVSSARYPAALAGASRAEQGSVAIPVASIVDRPPSVSFAFAPAAHGLATRRQLERLDQGARRPSGAFSGGGGARSRRRRAGIPSWACGPAHTASVCACWATGARSATSSCWWASTPRSTSSSSRPPWPSRVWRWCTSVSPASRYSATTSPRWS